MSSFNYLLDTNVISAGARSALHSELSRWLEQNSDRLWVCAITVAEIETGIAKLRNTGSDRRALALVEWLDGLLQLYSARLLPFDIPAARIAGRFSALARSRGINPGFADVAIAAIASACGLRLLTRNTSDFAMFGIGVHDPFTSLPD